MAPNPLFARACALAPVLAVKEEEKEDEKDGMAAASAPSSP